MGWCHVGADAGAKAVADLLMFNSSLAVLDLRGNGLGNAGAAHLARSLKEHTNDKLTELDLGYNEIKDEGACTLAQVRCRLPPLVVCKVFDYFNQGGATGCEVYRIMKGRMLLGRARGNESVGKSVAIRHVLGLL